MVLVKRASKGVRIILFQSRRFALSDPIAPSKSTSKSS